MRDFADVSMNLQPKERANASPSIQPKSGQQAILIEIVQPEYMVSAYLALKPVSRSPDRTCCLPR